MVHLCMKHECFKQAVFHFSKLRFYPNFQEGNLQIVFPAVVATSIFLFNCVFKEVYIYNHKLA